MKKLGLILIALLLASIIPVSSQVEPSNVFETSFGTVNVGPTITTITDGERTLTDSWSLEKLKDTNWIKSQTTDTVLSDKTLDKITIKKSGTTTRLDVEYINLENSIKILTKTTVEESGHYRLTWNIEGGNVVYLGDTYCLFENGYSVDWFDVLETIGEIYQTVETKNGLTVTFLIGDLVKGESFILDPIISPGNGGNVLFPRKNHIFLTDAGRTYAFWNEGSTRIRYSYSNDTVTWSTLANPPSIADGFFLADWACNGTHFIIPVCQSGDANNLRLYVYEDTETGLNLVYSDTNIYDAGGGEDIDDLSCDFTDFTNIWIGMSLDIGVSEEVYLLNGDIDGLGWGNYAGFPELLITETGSTSVSVQHYGAESAKAAVYENAGQDVRIYDEVRTGSVTTLELTDTDVLGGGNVRIQKISNSQWVLLCGTEFFNSTGGGAWTGYGVQILDNSEVSADGTNLIFYAVDNAPDGVYAQRYDTTYGFREPFQIFDNATDTSDYLSCYPNTTIATGLFYTFTNATSTYPVYEEYDYSPPDPTVLSATAPATVSKDEWAWLNVTVQDVEGHGLITIVDTQVNTTGDVNKFTLRWVQTGDVFSELSDPDGILTLNGGVSAAVNTTAMLLSMNITITGGQQGNCDVYSTVTTIDALTGSRLFASVFYFSVFNWDEEIYDLINSLFGDFGILGYMTLITTYINGFTGWFSSSLTRLLELMVQQFRIINAVYTFFTYWFTAIVGIVLDFSEYYQSILDGTYAIGTGLGNIWNLIGYNSWAPIIPLALFLWWIDSLPKRAAQTVGGELQVFINDISTAINLVSYFTGIFMSVANTVIDRILGLLGAKA